MKHTLSAKEQSLARIFSDDYVFSIPGYQRPYSWGIDQARELLDDLRGYMQAGDNKLEDMAPYFLGSIVLIKKEGIADATVVDGQQRLTTLTLLFSAIRATVQDAGMQQGITKRIYEHGDVVTATPARYRLLLRDRDRDFFRQYVQHEGGIAKLVVLNEQLPDAQKRLQSNAKLFLDELSKLDETTLVRLVQFIATRCFLVTVATPDLDSAYRIFGVLNSRGLDLSATDILKAEVIGSVAVNKRDSYTVKWEGLEEDLGREAFSELFSHIRMVYRKAKPQGTLLKEFRDHVGLSDSERFIDLVLVPMAQAFREITDADFSSQKHAEEINATLSWLNRIEFKDWMPPALAFFSRHRNEPIAMLRFFDDLERLAYSVLVRRAGVNERIERFSALTAAIETGQELTTVNSPLQLSPKEQYATFEALSGPLYDTHSARALSVILLRLDGLLSGGGATYKHDVITVEHVLPQQPKLQSDWTTWLPSPQERLLWVHRLGNLALLTRKKNSAARNYGFERKKNAYFTKDGVSPFPLTTQVLQHSQWTLQVMEERQHQLMSVLEKHWRLQDRQSPQAIVMQHLAAQVAPDEFPEFVLESATHDLHASARQVDGRLIVLAGSKAKAEWTGPDHNFQALRQLLIDDGQLQRTQDGGLVFTTDVSFNSPSAASAVILARPDNGRMSWKLKASGHTFAEWQAGIAADEQAQALNPGSSGDRHRILYKFWAQFIERCKASSTLFANRSPSADHWLSTGVGRTGFWLDVILTQTVGRVDCNVRLAGDKGTTSAFNQLLVQREAIESDFGGALEWQPLPNLAKSRISVQIAGGWKLDESQWEPFQEELIGLANRLANALRDRIRRIDIGV